MIKMKKYILLFLMLFFASLNFNLILRPIKLVTGGTQGLALILNNLFEISPALIIFFINLIMLIISYFTLPKTTTYGSLIATFLYPLLIKITSFLPIIKISNFTIISACLSGIICGITSGYIYKLGFSSGGLNLLALIINKKFHIKIALTNAISNIFLILISCFSFGIIKSSYSIIVVLINSYLVNKILTTNT